MLNEANMAVSSQPVFVSTAKQLKLWGVFGLLSQLEQRETASHLDLREFMRRAGLVNSVGPK